jgi:hypothetical protein
MASDGPSTEAPCSLGKPCPGCGVAAHDVAAAAIRRWCVIVSTRRQPRSAKPCPSHSRSRKEDERCSRTRWSGPETRSARSGTSSRRSRRRPSATSPSQRRQRRRAPTWRAVHRSPRPHRARLRLRPGPPVPAPGPPRADASRYFGLDFSEDSIAQLKRKLGRALPQFAGGAAIGGFPLGARARVRRHRLLRGHRAPRRRDARARLPPSSRASCKQGRHALPGHAQRREPRREQHHVPRLRRRRSTAGSTCGAWNARSLVAQIARHGFVGHRHRGADLRRQLDCKRPAVDAGAPRARTSRCPTSATSAPGVDPVVSAPPPYRTSRGRLAVDPRAARRGRLTLALAAIVASAAVLLREMAISRTLGRIGGGRRRCSPRSWSRPPLAQLVPEHLPDARRSRSRSSTKLDPRRRARCTACSARSACGSWSSPAWLMLPLLVLGHPIARADRHVGRRDRRARGRCSRSSPASPPPMALTDLAKSILGLERHYVAYAVGRRLRQPGPRRADRRPRADHRARGGASWRAPRSRSRWS